MIPKSGLVAFPVVVLLAATAGAEMMDRPAGIKIGQRMTLKPYVSASASYDSNVGSRNEEKEGDVMWTVNPGLGLTYNAENWALQLDAYYAYHAYCRNERTTDYNNHSYGENLRWNWSDSKGGEKGWSLMLTESFQQVTMADDMTYNGGTYNADRQQFNVAGGVQRRFNEHWHTDLDAGYYWLNYDNDNKMNASLYGWQRWTAGLAAGFAPSPWTDFIIAGSYQGYEQDNAGRYVSSGRSRNISSSSDGWTLQGGIGSYATERISYRLLAGWSRFNYGNGAKKDNGFIYSASGNWKISDTLSTMLLASSYYQPSEREYASAARVDSVSWGLAKSFIRGKLVGTLDAVYRHETHKHVDTSSGNYDIDVVTGRIGLTYTLNRFFSFFTYGEYQNSWNSHSGDRGGAYDYDRWLLTAGVRLTY